ncbi:peptidase domain-containing ABC transporter [Moorena sp. SIO3B2]|uniref:peptidase domain-containing ABC transporter n=1 Tax=Moorena sp. SIO3B2 TaxID=2607827 RepID=UPI0013C617EF|nr:peptidase domain-containing ABC transporter [Moorena sp. SIO3B2]NEP35577.1 type I secretion system permease/ATPase [Moorena sp. SIO3B2]
MTFTTSPIQEFITSVSPFNQLPTTALEKLSAQLQPVHYHLGETILMREKIPSHVVILYQGQARLLGYDPRTNKEVTVQKLSPGAILGWASLVRQVYSETAIASEEVDCLALPAKEFFQLLQTYPSLATAFQDHCALIEIFDLLGAELERRADGITELRKLALKGFQQAVVYHFPPADSAKLDPEWMWFVSGGNPPPNLPVGSRINSQNPNYATLQQVRLVGLPKSMLSAEVATGNNAGIRSISATPELEFRPARDAIAKRDQRSIALPESLPVVNQGQEHSRKYPFKSGRGILKETLACFEMLSEYLQVPFKREVIQRVITNQQKTGTITLPFCAAIADLMGLQTQLVKIAATTITQLPTPALIRWEDTFAVVYNASPKEVVLGIPTSGGIKRRKLSTFIDIWGKSGQVLLLKEATTTPKKKFGLSWFIPILSRYRQVLFEVLIASFFVQLFGLVNPLMTQVIIDQVIGGNSLDTLHVLGILLIVVALFEAILSALRTYLFSDTTNRIDLALASQVIDHLVRLPMSYFGKRTVGELATRVQELEKIRSFLTGTALTVVLDAVFSVIYIAVMVLYSPLLTLAALAVVPLFILLTLIFSPILRRMLRTKAQRNAQTHSYLVEVLNGIETVKSQNIELRARMSWQQRYGGYISEGFKTVKLSTTASSISNFLHKLSSLLVLWVGAYLVLQSELTLGELIAFRIIAGYVTSPLLRLSQLWQNFQETALSIERLSDILNHPQESPVEQQNNLTIPPITGTVKYENISFRFGNSGPLQLSKINLDIPAGCFVGIVGQSGSGKSTLTKLLPRFYEPLGGRIIIDNYDISKVELYSLRRQLGIVPQNPLLFEGTIHENIALNNPEATTEEIIATAKIAAAHDFIMDLPNGYNTQVGERGSALSGGQRQRIAIARAVLQNPRLLILDEATSALDYETEQRVCTNLAEAFKGRTVLFITHRLSTIKNSDLILMMSKGVIEEMGTHQELMAIKGRYYCLYK